MGVQIVIVIGMEMDLYNLVLVAIAYEFLPLGPRLEHTNGFYKEIYLVEIKLHLLLDAIH